MIAAKTFNLKGEALKETSLPEEVFGVKVKPVLLAQAVRVHLANQRAGSAKTKTRGDLNKTTAKMYRQKGTGRARHGTYAAPIFVGGGIAHGPDGLQNYRLTMPAKMRKLALLGALSEKAANGSIRVISGAEEASGKTKELGWVAGRVLVITSATLNNFNRAVRNLDQVKVLPSATINTYDIISARELVMAKEAIAELKKHYVA